MSLLRKWVPTYDSSVAACLALRHIRQRPAHILSSASPFSASTIMPSYLYSGPWQKSSLQSIVPYPYISVAPALEKFVLAPKLCLVNLLDVVMEPYVLFCPFPTSLYNDALCPCVSFPAGPCVYGRTLCCITQTSLQWKTYCLSCWERGRQTALSCHLLEEFLPPAQGLTHKEAHI